MIKFKKDINAKIISGIIALVFFIQSAGYSSGLSTKYYLRKPFMDYTRLQEMILHLPKQKLTLEQLQQAKKRDIQRKLIMLARQRVAMPATPKLFLEPLLPMYWEASLSDLPMEVKISLEKQLQENPGLLKAVFRDIQEHALVIPSSVINWLLGLPEQRYKPLVDALYESERVNLDLQDNAYATRYGIIRAVLQELQFKASDVFIDLGSGDGRVVLYTACASDVGQAKGFELVRERAQLAEEAKNQRSLDNVQFIQGNIREHLETIEDGTVFFIFNPFSIDTWTIVEQKLKDVAVRRKIRIVSVNEHGLIEKSLGKQSDWLKPAKEITTQYGIVNIYESVTSAKTQGQNWDDAAKQSAKEEFTFGLDNIIGQLNNRQEPIIALGDSSHHTKELDLFAARAAQDLNGLTHIILEISESLQPDIDEYLKTGHITLRMEDFISHGTSGYAKIFEVARKRGIRIIAADARGSKDTVDIKWPLDYYVSEKIRHEINEWEKDQGLPVKMLVYFGLGHIWATGPVYNRNVGNTLGTLLKYRYGAYLISTEADTTHRGIKLLEGIVLKDGFQKQNFGVFGVKDSFLKDKALYDQLDGYVGTAGKAYDAVIYIGRETELEKPISLRRETLILCH